MMNRNLLLTILPLLILVYSCTKKDDVVNPDDKNQKLNDVTFNVAHLPYGYTYPVISDTLKKYVNRLEYLVYDSLGRQVKDTIQNSSSVNFSIIKIKLRAGNYKVHVIGSVGSVNIGNLSNSAALFLSPLNNVMDAWMTKSIDLKVTTDQVQSQNVLIERVQGRLEVAIVDEIPSAATRLSVSYSSNTAYYLNTGSHEVSSQEREVEVVAKPGINLTEVGQIADFIIPDSNGNMTSNVTVRAYNAAGSVIAQKIIPNVKFGINKITLLTGNLFKTAPAYSLSYAGTGYYRESVGAYGFWYIYQDSNF